MTALSAAVVDAKTRFAAAGLPDAAIEARLLIGGLLGMSSTDMFTGGDRVLSAEEEETILSAVQRRLSREPVHRILGRRDFFGLDLMLSKETLEPRPDTEVLVERILPMLKRVVADKGAASLLDLGTGTGAIALALLAECPGATAVVSDISDDALGTAVANAKRLGLDHRLTAVRSDWFSEISGVFDIIVSNPPYIRSDVIPDLDPEVRDFDPPAALDGGGDGLDAYRAIAAGAAAALHHQGKVGVEIGYDQKDTVIEVFASAGFALVEAVRDYGGNDRVLLFSVNRG